MNKAIAVQTGRFGRAAIYELRHRLVAHAHREGHMVVHLGGGQPHLSIAGASRPLQMHSVGAIGSWQPHSLKFHENSGTVRMLILYIDTNWFHDCVPVQPINIEGIRFGQRFFQLPNASAPDLQALERQLLMNRNGTGLTRLVERLVTECFWHSWSDASVLDLPALPHVLDHDHRLEKVFELIQKDSDQGWQGTLQDFASQAGLSRAHLHRLFRDQIGVSPRLYINTLRMETAITSVSNLHSSITDVAQQLGFAEHSNFTRFFTSNVGVSPIEYRRALHGYQ